MTKILSFKNYELGSINTALNSFSLAGQASRGRNKLILKINDKINEFNDEIIKAKKQYFETDKNGQLVVLEGNQLKPLKGADLVACQKEQQNIGSEKVGIEFTEYSEKIKALYEALEKYDEPLNGDTAMAYDMLLDQLEENYKKVGE